MNTSQTKDLVGVFRQASDPDGVPDFYLTRDEARDLKKLDQAFFINHGNDICLLECEEESITLKALDEDGRPFINRDQSRKIKERTMDRAIGIIADKKLGPFLRYRQLMPNSNRKKPLAVVAVESWA